MASWHAKSKPSVNGTVMGSSKVRVSPATPFLTVQAGVDATADGDVVLLLDGVYSGAGNTMIEVSERAITIASASSDPTAVVLTCAGVPDTRIFNINQAPQGPTTIAAMSMVGCQTDEGGAMKITTISAAEQDESSVVSVVGVVFQNVNSTGQGGAIYSSLRTQVTLRSCFFVLCYSNGGVVSHTDAGLLFITDCTFQFLFTMPGTTGSSLFRTSSSQFVMEDSTVDTCINKIGRAHV